jgi:hypothetical protein
MNSRLGNHVDEFRKINSGVHIAILGTTRGGKTTLATGHGKGILSHFENVLVIDSTGDPGSISHYGQPVTRWGSINGHRRLTVNDMSQPSKEKIHKYLQRAVSQKNTAIYVDEVRQICDKKFFGLQHVLDHIWLFGAKHGISLIGSSQAPRWLPSSFYDQSKMHFIFGMRDRRAMKRLADISGDVDTLERVIPELKRYQFANVGIDGDVVISKFELPRKPQPPKEPVLVVYPS